MDRTAALGTGAPPLLRTEMSNATGRSVILVADIGGTFARFALAQGGRLRTDVVTLPRNSANDLPGLCALARQRFKQTIDGAAIAVAAPVSGGSARMTNVGWEVDERTLAQALSLAHVVLINDFAALALSLPTLAASDSVSVPPFTPAAASDEHVADLHAPRVVFGPGTGLGVAALVHHDGRPLPIASEGGHISFTPVTRFEQLVQKHAATRFERVSWERILSGQGLELINEVSRCKFALPSAPRTAQQIIETARDGTCMAAAHSIACFAELIGSFGGDLALTFRADGGVVIGGGIVARIAPLIALPSVRQRFTQKGRFSGWLDALPLAIMTNQNTALTGAARAFTERFAEPAGHVASRV